MTSRLRASLLSWKKKAIQRREEKKNLQKRLEESRESSSNWKLKYREMAEENKQLRIELKKKTNLTKDDNKAISTINYPYYKKEETGDFKIVSNNGGKIPNFRYDITYIQISMRMKIEGNISFRGIAATNHIF